MKPDSPTPSDRPPATGRPASPIDRRRRATALVMGALMAVGAVGGLTQGLASCQRDDQSDQARPLTTAEATRLATMRSQNYRDGRSGLRATIGQPGRQLHLAGWVDWRRPLAYLAVGSAPSGWLPTRPGATLGAPASGDGGEPVQGLIQAAPGVLATRMGPPIAGPGSGDLGRSGGTSDSGAARDRGPEGAIGMPPAEPPSDGWSVRRMRLGSPADNPVDMFVTLLFTIAREQPDAAGLLARSDARWLRREEAAGVPVDVLLGPAVPPVPETPPTTAQPTTAQPTTAQPTTPPATAQPNTPPATAQPTTAQPTGTGAPTTAGGMGPGPGRLPAAAPGPGTYTARPSAPEAAAPTSLARMGGAVYYWLDAQARVHRLEALLARDLPVRIELLRHDRAAPTAIDALGGGTVTPRGVTKSEARALSRLRQHNMRERGATITITVPGPDGGTRAAGWIDWRDTVAYLRLAGAGHPAHGTLLRADRAGVASRAAPRTSPRRLNDTAPGKGRDYTPGNGPDDPPGDTATAETPAGSAGNPDESGNPDRPGDPDRPGGAGDRDRSGNPDADSPDNPGNPDRSGGADPPAAWGRRGEAAPPLPPPAGRAWRFSRWSAPPQEHAAYDVELLLNELLSLTSVERDRPAPLRAQAVWLRADRVAGRNVTVYELPKPIERGVRRGQAQLRYWVTRNGTLLRLELRTPAGSFAQLDLVHGPVPELPPVPLRRRAARAAG